MKLSKPIVLAFSLLLATTYAPAHDLEAKPPSSTPARLSEVEMTKLIDRLKEIKAMPLKSLTRKERRELRKEVKSIERELKANSNGVYLSVGAVIIIALLLILIL